MAPQRPEERTSHQQSQCSDDQETSAQCDDSSLPPRATRKRKRTNRQGEKEHAPDTAIEAAASSTAMPQGQQESLTQSRNTPSVMETTQSSISLPMESSGQRNISTWAEGALESLDPSQRRKQTQSHPYSNLASTAPPRAGLVLQLTTNMKDQAIHPSCRVAMVIGVHKRVFKKDFAVPFQELSSLAEICPCHINSAGAFSAIITSHIFKVSGLKEVPECCLPGAKVDGSEEDHALEPYLYRLGNIIAVMQHLHSWENCLGTEQENLTVIAKVHIVFYLKIRLDFLLKKSLETIGSKSKDNLLKPRFTQQVKTLQLCLRRALDICQTLYSADLFRGVKIDLEAKIATLEQLIPASQKLTPCEGCKDCFQKLVPLNSSILGKCNDVYFAYYLYPNHHHQPLTLQPIILPPEIQKAQILFKQQNVVYFFNYAAC